MKILILIPSMHAGAELMLNKLLRRKDLNIVGIVQSNTSIFTKRLWKYILYTIKSTGIYYAFLIGLFFSLHILIAFIGSLCFWAFKKKRWHTTAELVKQFNIPLYPTDNINMPEMHAKILAINPDLMISIYFDQILKKDTLFLAKNGTINIHPGILPHYKGLWAHFWKRINKERHGGVTIHYMNEKVDDGDIIAQKKFRIFKRDTNFGLRLKAAQNGVKLLVDVLKKMKAGVKLPRIKPLHEGKYYSMPDKKAMELFYKRGGKLFSLKDIAKNVGG